MMLSGRHRERKIAVAMGRSHPSESKLYSDPSVAAFPDITYHVNERLDAKVQEGLRPRLNFRRIIQWHNPFRGSVNVETTDTG